MMHRKLSIELNMLNYLNVKRYGYVSYSIKIIDEYVCQQKIQVKWNTLLSSQHKISNGVKQ